MCQVSDNYAKFLRRFKLSNSTIDVCLPFEVGSNLTMTNRGRLKLKFGDWFKLTNERMMKMKDREIHELFKLKLIKEQ